MAIKAKRGNNYRHRVQKRQEAFTYNRRDKQRPPDNFGACFIIVLFLAIGLLFILSHI